jgi:membrane AbrB-like protein
MLDGMNGAPFSRREYVVVCGSPAARSTGHCLYYSVAGVFSLPSLKSSGNLGVVKSWLALIVLSTVFIALLEIVRLPAALLLGSLAAAIVLAAAEKSVRIPDVAFIGAQALIGCMIARAFQVPMLREILRDWPLFFAAVVSVLAVSCALSWALMRWRVLPGTTAIWGSFPGAAMVMTLMAEAYGEDVRLVAFMQYLRVVFVAIVASAVSRIWLGSASAVTHTVWFAAPAWEPLLATVTVATVGVFAGLKLRVPAGALLLPMILAAVLQDTGLLTIELPPWLLALSYAVIGWSIGIKFTRAILIHVAHALPRVTASILTLIASCGFIGYLLARVANVDPLTAYLATSPGGADSVAIIAAGSNVNMPFVMAMQTGRFMLLLLVGPALARFMARRASLPDK